MDEITRKAEHRILALDAANNLQADVGFGDKWKGLVENTIFALIEDGYRRGHQYPPQVDAPALAEKVAHYAKIRLCVNVDGTSSHEDWLLSEADRYAICQALRHAHESYAGERR